MATKGNEIVVPFAFGQEVKITGTTTLAVVTAFSHFDDGSVQVQVRYSDNTGAVRTDWFTSASLVAI